MEFAMLLSSAEVTTCSFKNFNLPAFEAQVVGALNNTQLNSSMLLWFGSHG